MMQGKYEAPMIEYARNTYVTGSNSPTYSPPDKFITKIYNRKERRAMQAKDKP